MKMEKTTQKMTREQVVETVADIYGIILETQLKLKRSLENLEDIQKKLEEIPEKPEEIIS